MKYETSPDSYLCVRRTRKQFVSSYPTICFSLWSRIRRYLETKSKSEIFDYINKLEQFVKSKVKQLQTTNKYYIWT